jgi:aminoglycoside phosphotransferase (APT) family kinase protein
VASRASPSEVLVAACASAGLNGEGAEVLHDRANTVYRLARKPIVARLRYAPPPSPWTDRLSVSVRVTGWLNTLGFPAVRPLDVEQPVIVDGYLVTFWHYLEATAATWEDVDSLARLLRRLHALPAPPLRLPAVSPLGSLPGDTERCPWLTDAERSWLLSRYEDLQQEYEDTTWALGCGMIHGDAYAENLIHTRDQVVMSDWDSVSYGPREQDIVPTSIRHRFGRPKTEWDRFCAAYGVDPADLPGLTVLRQMRELRSLGPYIRSTGRPQAQAEANRRIHDLMNGTQHEPWRLLDLTL